MFSLQFFKKPSVFLPLFFLFLYSITSPYTVQSGDTGELVTNSYFLRVSHPPGYPLWTLLYHIPVRYLNFGNPFSSASYVTIGISLIWLHLLMRRFDRKNECLIVSVLASSLLVWRYSILPDVFSLHVLFLVVVFLIFEKPDLLEKNWIVFLISLGVTNHHTILFAFPLFLYAFLVNPSKKKLYISILSGMLSFSFYFLLLLFHPEDYGSWNNVGSFKSLIGHFLRTDYGTMSLMAHPEDKSSWINFFFTKFFQDSWSVIIVFFFLLTTQRDAFKANKKKISIIIFSLFIYLFVFSKYGTMDLAKDAESVFERFLIHPTLLIFFLVLFLVRLGSKELPKWITLLLLTNVGLNIVRNYSANNYKKNTYIEDYLLNVLNTLPKDVVYFTTGDTFGFSTYYLKDVLKIRPDVIHIHSTWANEWFLKKFRAKYPNIFKSDAPTFNENFDFDGSRLFTNFSPNSLSSGYARRNHGLIFEIAKLKETKAFDSLNCDFNYTWRNRPSIDDYQNFEIGLVYDLKYGDCYFAEAGIHLISQKIDFAKDSILSAIKLSPNNPSYLENLCKIYKLKRDPLLEDCKNKLINIYSTMNPKYYEFIE